MRHRNVGVLALGLGLAVAGVVLAEQPTGSDGGSWWSRLFSHRSSAPTIRKEEPGEAKGTASIQPGSQRTHAQADYLRRLEVCDRLREIAFQTGDSELMHTVDQLEQRVADAYSQKTKIGSSFDEEVLQGRLAPKTPASPLRGAGKASKTDGRAALEGRP